MPVMPAAVSFCFTSSSLNGLMIASIFFIRFPSSSLWGAVALPSERGERPNDSLLLYISKYRANSQGWGRSRMASTSAFLLYSSQVSITSLVNTSPLSKNSWSFSKASSAWSNDPGMDFTLAASSGSNSYKFLSIGLGGSILFLIPSSPAISMAGKAKYGLALGSGVLNSSLLAFSLVEYMGIRTQALRFLAE